jgi:hypothetical protein
VIINEWVYATSITLHQRCSKHATDWARGREQLLHIALPRWDACFGVVGRTLIDAKRDVDGFEAASDLGKHSNQYTMSGSLLST